MKLRVGYLTLPVRLMEPGESGDEGADGKFRPQVARIDISPDLAPARQAETLVHELLHACWFATSLPEKPTEEVAVTALAKQLCQVLRDNPTLPGVLLAGLEGFPMFSGSTPAEGPAEASGAPPRPRPVGVSKPATRR